MGFTFNNAIHNNKNFYMGWECQLSFHISVVNIMFNYHFELSFTTTFNKKSKKGIWKLSIVVNLSNSTKLYFKQRIEL